ncbi:hypothetical protein ACB478_000659 [Klebsiella quasipneumoniae]
MSGRIEQVNGIVVNTGVKLYRNPAINKGTRALFDMSNKSSGGQASTAAGAVIKSRSYEDSTGTLLRAHNYANGGMIWEGVSGDQFQLPAQFVPDISDKHWLFTVWLKVTSGGSSGFNNQTLNIGPAYNIVTAHLRIVPTCDANGKPSNIEVRCMAKQYVVTSQLLPLYDGNVHQLSVECEISADGTQQKMILWLDGVSVFNSGFAAISGTLPSDSSQRYIGTSASLPRSWAGTFYGVRFDDLVTSDMSASDVIASDSAFYRKKYT